MQSGTVLHLALLKRISNKPRNSFINKFKNCKDLSYRFFQRKMPLNQHFLESDREEDLSQNQQQRSLIQKTKLFQLIEKNKRKKKEDQFEISAWNTESQIFEKETEEHNNIAKSFVSKNKIKIANLRERAKTNTKFQVYHNCQKFSFKNVFEIKRRMTQINNKRVIPRRLSQPKTINLTYQNNEEQDESMAFPEFDLLSLDKQVKSGLKDKGSSFSNFLSEINLKKKDMKKIRI